MKTYLGSSIERILTCIRNHPQCPFQLDHQIVPRNPSLARGIGSHCSTSLWPVKEENKRISALFIFMMISDSCTGIVHGFEMKKE